MSQQGVTPSAFQADILDALTVAMTGLITGSKLELLKAPIPPDVDLTLADCVAGKANFDGYAAKAVTAWQPAAKDENGLVRVDSDNKQWLASGVTVSNTIYGVYMTDGMGMVLQQVWALPNPVIMGVDLLQGLDFVASFYFPAP